MKTFAEVWAQKEREGYQYGEDALEGVRFGWTLASDEMEPRLAQAELQLASRDARIAEIEADLRRVLETAKRDKRLLLRARIAIEQMHKQLTATIAFADAALEEGAA